MDGKGSEFNVGDGQADEQIKGHLERVKARELTSAHYFQAVYSRCNYLQFTKEEIDHRRSLLWKQCLVLSGTVDQRHEHPRHVKHEHHYPRAPHKYPNRTPTPPPLAGLDCMANESPPGVLLA